MTYPTEEKKQQIAEDEKNQRLKEAELYIDSNSFEEFELKRTIAGIMHNVFNDIFKYYYFYNDKCKWLYCRSGFHKLTTSVALLSTCTTIIMFFELSLMTWLCIFLPFTAIVDLVFLVNCWTCFGARVAQDSLWEVNQRRKEQDNAATIASIKVPTISSLSSCVTISGASYVTTKSNALSC